MERVSFGLRLIDLQLTLVLRRGPGLRHGDRLGCRNCALPLDHDGVGSGLGGEPDGHAHVVCVGGVPERPTLVVDEHPGIHGHVGTHGDEDFYLLTDAELVLVRVQTELER